MATSTGRPTIFDVVPVVAAAPVPPPAPPAAPALPAVLAAPVEPEVAVDRPMAPLRLSLPEPDPAPAPTSAPVAVEPTPVREPDAEAARRRTSWWAGVRRARYAVGLLVAVACLACAGFLVASGLLAVASTNADSGVVAFIDDAADALDLGFFDLGSGVVRFDGTRAVLKETLLNRALAALVWVGAAVVVQRLVGGPRRA